MKIKIKRKDKNYVKFSYKLHRHLCHMGPFNRLWKLLLACPLLSSHCCMGHTWSVFMWLCPSSLFCCCTASMEQATDGAETAAIDGLVCRVTLGLSSCDSVHLAFSVAAPRAWNRLPMELRSPDLFRRDLKTFLFHSVYGHQDADWLCDAPLVF